MPLGLFLVNFLYPYYLNISNIVTIYRNIKVMNFSALEITLISIQILLVPLVRYVLEQNRKDIINELLKVISEHYSTLDNLIEHNKSMIKNLEIELEYKAKLVKFKNRTLIARLTDLEQFLAKTSNFQPKCTFFFESDFDDEEELHSGSY